MHGPPIRGPKWLWIVIMIGIILLLVVVIHYVEHVQPGVIE